jgi:hypothetical protein
MTCTYIKIFMHTY